MEALEFSRFQQVTSYWFPSESWYSTEGNRFLYNDHVVSIIYYRKRGSKLTTETWLIFKDNIRILYKSGITFSTVRLKNFVYANSRRKRELRCVSKRKEKKKKRIWKTRIPLESVGDRKIRMQGNIFTCSQVRPETVNLGGHRRG